MSPERNFPETTGLTSKEKIELFLKKLNGQVISLAEGKETKIIVKNDLKYVELEFEGYPGALHGAPDEVRETTGNYIALALGYRTIDIKYAGVMHPDLQKGGLSKH